MIGMPEGASVAGSTGRRFLVLRPTLSDVVLKMPRGAQVIYPKDLAAILMEADIAPGARVLEAGVGSGALSMALLRAGASVVGYELREDFAGRARANVDRRVRAVGSLPGRVARRLRGDRRARARPGSARSTRALAGRCATFGVRLRPGGILCAYLPTINQTAELRRALDEGGFGLTRTIEVLYRTWHIERRSVRPDHRMVGHTGFVTSARLLLDAVTGGNGGNVGKCEPGGPRGANRAEARLRSADEMRPDPPPLRMP